MTHKPDRNTHQGGVKCCALAENMTSQCLRAAAAGPRRSVCQRRSTVHFVPWGLSLVFAQHPRIIKCKLPMISDALTFWLRRAHAAADCTSRPRRCILFISRMPS